MNSTAKTDELFRLSERYFRPGVITNFFLDRAAAESELEAGTLTVRPFDGGFAVLREREGYRLMQFSIMPDAELPEMPPHTVTEVPMRARGGDEKKVMQLLADDGFALLFRRIRLTRLPDETTGSTDPCITTATADDMPAALALMKACFDRRTGCLPTADELREERVYVYRQEGEIVGCLHEKDGRAASELRHLCTASSVRGTGIASRLTDAYLSNCTKKSRVWVREDYAAARHVYESRGYSPDGMISLVMAKD